MKVYKCPVCPNVKLEKFECTCNGHNRPVSYCIGDTGDQNIIKNLKKRCEVLEHSISSVVSRWTGGAGDYEYLARIIIEESERDLEEKDD